MSHCFHSKCVLSHLPRGCGALPSRWPCPRWWAEQRARRSPAGAPCSRATGASSSSAPPAPSGPGRMRNSRSKVEGEHGTVGSEHRTVIQYNPIRKEMPPKRSPSGTRRFHPHASLAQAQTLEGHAAGFDAGALQETQALQHHHHLLHDHFLMECESVL